ncbi:MAG: hypothetical protein IKD40_01380 [Bacteroidaceae bacterium]|nr:hypothetical protein [Bacteroidaceae bacterium]
MSIIKLECFNNGGLWETAPHCCNGGDIRIRVHKNGPYPVNVMVSIDGVEEYLHHDDFGFDEQRCEVTLEGTMPGQYIKLSSKSELLLVKYLIL